MQDALSTISIVDDDPSVRKALVRLMRSVGYQTLAYESAEQFVSAGDLEHSSCLILDVHLPGMSGLELQATLRQRRSTLPIVFISAFSDVKSQSQAMQNGAIGYLPKPLDTKKLFAVIGKALEVRRT